VANDRVEARRCGLPSARDPWYAIGVRRFPAILALCAVSAACGGETRLEADPREVKADGTSAATITFHDDHDDGSAIYFETDLGHFLDEDGYETQSLTRALSGGRATVSLYSGIRPGTATVTASNDFGDSATVAVRFVALRPSSRSLTFDCEAVNLGALREPVPDLAAACHVRMQDRDGAPVDPRGLEAGSFGFVAEAGQVRPEVVDDGYGNVYFLYTTQGGQTSPVDVTPINGEPSRAGDVGGTNNPRDGLVTIVAWVRGEEGFHDINSNGLYEPLLGETFTDSGEPFLDVDDDGEFDAGAGDLTIDLDGDGRYTPPNGTWDEDTVIWTTFKLLWSGAAHESAETSRVGLEGGGRELRAGETRRVEVVILDRNMNPIAATSENSVTIYPGCYACSLPSNYSFALSNTRGFDIDESGGVRGNLFEPPRFGLSITNTNSYEAPETFTISVTGDTTPGPMTATGDYPENVPISLADFEATLLGAPAE
jgi:hypothetical protein